MTDVEAQDQRYADYRKYLGKRTKRPKGRVVSMRDGKALVALDEPRLHLMGKSKPIECGEFVDISEIVLERKDE